MRVSASQLSSFARCPQQYKFEKVEHVEGGRVLSATIFGTVVHHAVHVFERRMAEGTSYDEALEVALASFEKYWHPYFRHEITGDDPETPVEWMRGHSQGTLLHRGKETIRKYADVWRYDDHRLLALEHPFEVPVEGTNHTISGFVDRLVLRQRSFHGKRVWVLDTDDFKTGRRKYHLRHHIGLTVYAYASTQRAFWDTFGVDADAMYEQLAPLPRHVNWYDLQGFSNLDGGFRGPKDYRRLARAVDEMAASVAAGIYPLRIEGDICEYCPFRDICPDETGLPDEEHGAP